MLCSSPVSSASSGLMVVYLRAIVYEVAATFALCFQTCSRCGYSPFSVFASRICAIAKVIAALRTML